MTREEIDQAVNEALQQLMLTCGPLPNTELGRKMVSDTIQQTLRNLGVMDHPLAPMPTVSTSYDPSTRSLTVELLGSNGNRLERWP